MRFRFPQVAIVAAAVVLFAIANRGAHEAYFSDDDLDNIANTLLPGTDLFWKGWLSPQFDRFNFRPVGHFTYRLLAQQFGLRFEWFVAFIQLLHLVNVGLLFWLLRRWEFSAKAAGAASLVFAFQPALFAAFWKPMYLFDLWCGFFVLLVLHSWRSGWLIPSIVAFWCAYKAKEVCIFLPLVLVIQSPREWMRAAVLGLISLSFGGQALIANSARNDDYALRGTTSGVMQSLGFYLAKSFGSPVLLAAAWWRVRDPRLLWGVAGFALLMIPLLLLPARLFAVYLYVPFVLLSVACAAVLERVPARALIVLMLVFCAASYVGLRRFRRAEIAQGNSARQFVKAACAVLPSQPQWKKAYYDGLPADRAVWGTIATYRLCNGRNLTMVLEPWPLGGPGPVIRFHRSLDQKQARLEVTDGATDWISGGYGWEEWFRWSAPQARWRVTGPVRVTVRPVPAQLPVTVEFRQSGEVIARQRLERPEFAEIAVASRAGEIEMMVPEFRAPGDTRVLGIPVVEVKRVP